MNERQRRIQNEVTDGVILEFVVFDWVKLRKIQSIMPCIQALSATKQEIFELNNCRQCLVCIFSDQMNSSSESRR